MPEDYEKRLIKMETLIERMDDSLEKIENTLSEALEVKGRVDNYGAQINALWIKFENAKTESDKFRQDYAVLKSQHDACMLKHRDDTGWMANRLGGLVDRLLPALLAVAVAYMATRLH